MICVGGGTGWTGANWVRTQASRDKAFALSEMKDEQAARVGDIIGTKPPVVSPALTGVVNKQVQKENEGLKKDVQSLKAQMTALKGKGSERNSGADK